MEPVRDDNLLPPLAALPPQPIDYLWPPRRKFADRRWLHAVLLLATIATTTWVGAYHYQGFESDLGIATADWRLANGLWYSATILAILGFHELGHYFACRYYDVDASLPFFIPLFLPAPLQFTGTLGAVIRIREPIPSKRMLFDIGIAGPIAGFVVAVPALFAGVALSRVIALPPDMIGASLGEPLLFKLAAWIMFGSVPEGYTISVHPVAFAAWFGLLATVLNLFPIAQLDGGHIAYAVLGRRARTLSLAALAGLVVLTFYSPSWLIWTVLTGLMLFRLGHHPPTFDDHVPIDGTRRRFAVLAVVIFIVCFTPAPISIG